MITRDLDRALGTANGSAGTWRPPPASPGPGAGPPASGSYAGTVAFALARAGGGAPQAIAEALAERLRPLGWVERAVVTGGGYLTVTVTPDALAALAVRITQAGPGCARSDALRGSAVTAPSRSGLLTAGTWPQARSRLARHLTGRLAEAAGAQVTWTEDSERVGTGQPPAQQGSGPAGEAIGFAGADAVIFALALLPPDGPAGLDPGAVAAHHLANPAYAVRYAHAHAASTLRQAADLGLDRGEAAGFRPRLLAHPREQALLGTLSWLPERVAGAARRGQPDVLARYLAELAGAYLDCQDHCPAVRPGMEPPGEGITAARLWLAAAARTALAAGLGLLGVAAPDRL